VSQLCENVTPSLINQTRTLYSHVSFESKRGQKCFHTVRRHFQRIDIP